MCAYGAEMRQLRNRLKLGVRDAGDILGRHRS